MNMIETKWKRREVLEKLFSQISVVDYAAMWIISKLMDQEEENRLYLTEIAEQLQVPMKEVTKVVQNLQGRGLIIWTHDGDGSDGTYIMITKNGSASIGEQQHTLHQFYSNIVRRFGTEKFTKMVSLIGEFEMIVGEEMENGEA